jgi:hypothetical protein
MLIVIILLATSLPMIATFDIKQIKIIAYNKAYATTDKLINSTSIDYRVGKNDGSIAAVHAFSGLNDLHYNTSVTAATNISLVILLVITRNGNDYLLPILL